MSGSAMANSYTPTTSGNPGRVEAKNGFRLLDVPAGATVWFRPELSGPIRIEYDATMVQRGGPNDRVSDRTGRFAEYDDRRVLRGSRQPQHASAATSGTPNFVRC